MKTIAVARTPAANAAIQDAVAKRLPGSFMHPHIPTAGPGCWGVYTRVNGTVVSIVMLIGRDGRPQLRMAFMNAVAPDAEVYRWASSQDCDVEDFMECPRDKLDEVFQEMRELKNEYGMTARESELMNAAFC